MNLDTKNFVNSVLVWTFHSSTDVLFKRVLFYSKSLKLILYFDIWVLQQMLILKWRLLRKIFPEKAYMDSFKFFKNDHVSSIIEFGINVIGKGSWKPINWKCLNWNWNSKEKSLKILNNLILHWKLSNFDPHSQT